MARARSRPAALTVRPPHLDKPSPDKLDAPQTFLEVPARGPGQTMSKKNFERLWFTHHAHLSELIQTPRERYA